jgi:predicted O-methyltransferase YrrM
MVPLIDLALERYTAEHTTPPCDLLAELAVVTREKMAAFNMQVGPVEGAFLRLLVGLSGASRVLRDRDLHGLLRAVDGRGAAPRRSPRHV